jgi:hypothetical protein
MLVVAPINAQVTTAEDSIYNYANSPYNYANSPYNYANSPYNFVNSPYNSQSPNATYDAQGRRNGYATKNDAGVTNYYDNNGTRRGYRTK